MGWTASLDMGSEKMVMALASGEGSVCHLKGIKIMASQGIEHGVIKDKEKVRMCIRSLMSELMKDREIEVMNVALSGAVLRIVERRIVVLLHANDVGILGPDIFGDRTHLALGLADRVAPETAHIVAQDTDRPLFTRQEDRMKWWLSCR